jgi:hypothetical protein
MAALQREQRQSVERTIISARAASEAAARAAIAALAVKEEKPHPQMSEDERRLRRALRAKSRQLGGDEALIAEIAYQHWHRMLFARFLAENGLLIYPDSAVAVSLDEVTDLAREEGEPDPWVMAARFAAAMLPGIFRSHEPVLEIRFAPEGGQRLEALLSSLPKEVFIADDALGRIGAAELPAVTQLFTEDYMVRFLLENSLGAWWAAGHPESKLLKRFIFLRFPEHDTSAVRAFTGWPDRAAKITVMDPCCGSGHFLTVAFEMLTAMRMEEEGLSALEAGDAVISDNLFGLELDPRCTQIAAFALALAAWRSGGYRRLPAPNIACSGVAVAGQLAGWTKLARGDARLESALAALHEQFRNAPELGSLIDPRRATEEGHLFSVDYDSVAPLLDELLAREPDPETQVAGWAAAGIARAASLLARTYTLVATNVPYLSIQRMGSVLAGFVERHFPTSASDLATCFLERSLTLAPHGSVAVVTLQGWLFLKTYAAFRRGLLKERSFAAIAPLGPGAFTGISGQVVQVVLTVLTSTPPQESTMTLILNAIDARDPDLKAAVLRSAPIQSVPQRDLARRPDALLTVGTSGLSVVTSIGDYATSWQGLVTGDVARFTVQFWEVATTGDVWERFLTAPKTTGPYTGRDTYLRWERGRGTLVKASKAHNFNPREALEKKGVLVGQSNLCTALYAGEMFNDGSVPIIPSTSSVLPAIWAFASSDEWPHQVRRINQKVMVGCGYFLKLPFDLEHWAKVAEELYPDGLPNPCSNDPTQWLFKGDPTAATKPLQVATARLLGYRWPDQEPDAIDEFADADGVVCIPAVAGDAPAADRLRSLLARAWGERFSPAMLVDLLARESARSSDLEAWLRDEFFLSHAALFHSRPFIWQIWDGRRDGFSALLNYHHLDQRLLNRITYTLLGAWIELQRDQVRREVHGAENRLAAALELQRKLQLIAQGEPPYDISVRWKSLARQPLGWDPDINDGVRPNIRPFVEAGVLRSNFTINWNKDRGTNPDGSERLNNLHATRADKEAARREAGRGPR